MINLCANSGYHTARRASLGGRNDLVIAVEPMTTAFDCHLRNVVLNAFEQVQHFEVAISDR